MKKLFWMMLAALPMQAMANGDDPIAYKCYYCTPAEMEDVALAQGVGRHYVYDYASRSIMGFEVAQAGGNLVANPFKAESWVDRQFRGMAALYDVTTSSMTIRFDEVKLLAPGTEHGREIGRMLWGHHLSALHPDHAEARETIHRYLTEHPELVFLDTTTSGGRLLKFAHSIENPAPILATMHMGEEFLWGGRMRVDFYFDHATRHWHFLDAKAGGSYFVQNSRDDFAPAEGRFTFDHHYNRPELPLAAFIERAGWASLPVHGEVVPGKTRSVRCERTTDDIQCYLD
ncbi:hypothetical protein [Stenotrophomonas oahuensis]|uniref:Uncharacterized protein n=1 Tax=Stenotrophomonas oahuensis TaxID=3003271 RepID=A0ABY9YPY3_9GAMM|nr:hypothetical protein [Stenotrophomonas sp. A5586]WNH52939.1 hypothetical protein PDM29_01335 [Stenotrophomonas sp. A5586]